MTPTAKNYNRLVGMGNIQQYKVLNKKMFPITLDDDLFSSLTNIKNELCSSSNRAGSR